MDVPRSSCIHNMGMRDWCFSPRYLRRWQLYYPQAQVLKLDDTGHYLLENECDKAIATIKDFLESSTINTEI